MRFFIVSSPSFLTCNKTVAIWSKQNSAPQKIGIADKVKNFAVIYLCDIDEVPDFNKMYELYDTVTIMFFFRNKHMMCDFGTGNNNKLNWVLEDKQELIDIVSIFVDSLGGVSLGLGMLLLSLACR